MRLLKETSNVEMFVNLENCGGMGPSKSLWDRSRDSITTRFTRVAGIRPARWFRERFKDHMRVRFPREGGIVPVSEFPAKFRTVTYLSSNVYCNMVPLM